MPALVAVFQPTGAAVSLQGNPQMVRPNAHAEFARQMVEDFVCGRSFGMRPDRLQRGVARRHAGSLLLRSAGPSLPTCLRHNSRWTSAPAPFGRVTAAAESCQHAFGDL